MPDAPDGYRYRIASSRHVLDDMSELAVRLGSVVSYHRSGTVIFADGMENGTAPYLEQYAGGGASVIPVVEPTFQGGLSIKCTGSTDETAIAGLLKRMQPVVLGKMGLEVTFSCESVNRSFNFLVQHNTGAVRRQYSVRINTDVDELQYRNPDSDWIAFEDYVIDKDALYLFHTVKLIVDLVKVEFVTLFIDQTEIDMSAYPVRIIDPDTSGKRLEFLAGVSSKDTENNVAYIDNFIITTDEP